MNNNVSEAHVHGANPRHKELIDTHQATAPFSVKSLLESIVLLWLKKMSLFSAIGSDKIERRPLVIIIAKKMFKLIPLFRLNLFILFEMNKKLFLARDWSRALSNQVLRKIVKFYNSLNVNY